MSECIKIYTNKTSPFSLVENPLTLKGGIYSPLCIILGFNFMSGETHEFMDGRGYLFQNQ